MLARKINADWFRILLFKCSLANLIYFKNQYSFNCFIVGQLNQNFKKGVDFICMKMSQRQWTSWWNICFSKLKAEPCRLTNSECRSWFSKSRWSLERTTNSTPNCHSTGMSKDHTQRWQPPHMRRNCPKSPHPKLES